MAAGFFKVTKLTTKSESLFLSSFYIFHHLKHIYA